MKSIVLYSFFILSSFFIWGQKASVQLTVEPQEVGVNQQFSITIKSNVEGNIVENWPSNFVKGYGVQSLSRYVQDFNNGKMVQEHVVIFTGSFNKAGNYKIGPFYVRAGNKTYTSTTATINVLNTPQQSKGGDEISKRQLNQPAFGVIEVSSTKIYEGEPLVVNGRVYAREQTFGRPVLKRPFDFNGVTDAHEIQQTEMWETKFVKGREYESFTFGKKVLFPVGSGALSINPFEVYLPFIDQDYTVVSSTPTVEVVPLPGNAPSNFIGGVGEFSIEQKYPSNQKVKQGDIIQLDLIISGKGNLHAIESPTIQLPAGMNTYGDAEVNEDYAFTSQGASGKITYTYHVQATKAGMQTIKPVSIAYFNPKTEKYETAQASNSIQIAVQENKAFNIQEDTKEIENNPLESDKQYNYNKVKELLTPKNSWIWYSSGGALLLSALIFFLMKRKKEEQPEETTAPKIDVVKEQPIDISVVQASINRLEFYLKQQHSELFYATLEKTLIHILNYKLQKPEHSEATRNELLNELSLSVPQLSSQLKSLFNKCDFSRYGMGSDESEMEQLLNEVKGLV
ncbi:MAG: BatD family protein [Crocinitomicaceae bacterium]|nr:BatD family protein [Crocinitomicaceae bacterium]